MGVGPLVGCGACVGCAVGALGGAGCGSLLIMVVLVLCGVFGTAWTACGVAVGLTISRCGMGAIMVGASVALGVAMVVVGVVLFLFRSAPNKTKPSARNNKTRIINALEIVPIGIYYTVFYSLLCSQSCYFGLGLLAPYR